VGSILFSFLYWAYAASVGAVLYLGALALRLATPFDPTRALLHRYTCWWAQLYLRCLPGCRVHVEGREKIPAHAACVLVANHQSLADIMALAALAVPFKWVSAPWVFRIPFVGWNMYLNAYVRVARGRTLDECRRWLRRGVPLLIFPEGQRSLSGELLPFHAGAFRLAVECGRPVVPVVVDGTLPVFRGLRVAAFPGRITVRVLDAVTPAEAGGAIDLLRDHVCKRMREALAALRSRRDEAPGGRGKLPGVGLLVGSWRLLPTRGREARGAAATPGGAS
jgi:1-acyl-sn-glycerol-3-phosphate acyltransferase